MSDLQRLKAVAARRFAPDAVHPIDDSMAFADLGELAASVPDLIAQIERQAAALEVERKTKAEWRKRAREAERALHRIKSAYLSVEQPLDAFTRAVDNAPWRDDGFQEDDASP